MKKYLIHSIKAIFLIFFLLAWFFGGSGNCGNERYIKQKTIKGRVIDKFLNKKEHMYPTLKITGYLRQYSFTDKSGFYDFVEIGDSLIKEKGSLDIRLIRKELDTTFTIDYGCNK